MGTMLRLACLEIRGCSCHRMASASVPRGQQHPSGTAAPLGNTKHPRRAWLSAPAGARVAPECTQPFGVPPSPYGCPQIASNPQVLEGPWGSPARRDGALGASACRGGWRRVPAADAADSGPSQMVPIFTPGPVIFSPWIKADGGSWVMPRKHPLGGCCWREP